eukprot:g27750.t1
MASSTGDKLSASWHWYTDGLRQSCVRSAWKTTWSGALPSLQSSQPQSLLNLYALRRPSSHDRGSSRRDKGRKEEEVN